MVAKRPVVQLCKLAHTALDAAADGGGPEYTMMAELEIARAPLSEKSSDLSVRSTSKEEYVVKIALPGKLGLSLREARVLRQFAGRERAQSDNGNTRILRERLQGLSGCRQGLRNRNARKATEAYGRGLLGR